MRPNGAEVILSLFSDVTNKQNALEDSVRLTSNENSDVRCLATSTFGSPLLNISDKQQVLNDCDTLNTAIRSEEYRSLIEEHKKIRGYIFERPLLIAAGIAALAQYILINEPKPTQLTLLLKLLAFPFMIYVFYYNLAFTAKNLVTDARIIAYIQLFHENCSSGWIGWESSLRYYRKWMNINTINGSLEDQVAKNIEKEYIYSKNWFYIQIYWFHIIVIFFILIMWSITAYYINPTASLILVLSSILILCYILNPLYPSKFDNLIEKQRAIWIMASKDKLDIKK